MRDQFRQTYIKAKRIAKLLFGRGWYRKLRHNLIKRGGVTDQEDYYRSYVDLLASDNPDEAIGSPSKADWLRLGDYYYQYLKKNGLKPSDRFLDIGCGNLRTGWRIIEFLEERHYVGLDISPEILLSANRNISTYSLQNKLPSLFLVRHMNFDFLPDNYFDVVLAHSVFSHCELATIRCCLESLHRVLKPSGYFDFTFLEAKEKNYDVNNENYYFVRTDIEEMLTNCRFTMSVMDDFDHIQTRIRARRISFAST